MASKSKSTSGEHQSTKAKGTYKVFFVEHETCKLEEYSKIPKEELIVSKMFKNLDRFLLFFWNMEMLFRADKVEGVGYLRDGDDYLDLKIVIKLGMELTIRMRFDDLYIYGIGKNNVKTGDIKWFELREKGDEIKINGSEETGYRGNYNALNGFAVKSLSKPNFVKAVERIILEPSKKKWKVDIAMIIKCISEPLRFTRVRDHFISRSAVGFWEEGKTPWDALENDWGKISSAIWTYHENPDSGINIRISYNLEFRSIEEVQSELRLIKQMKTTRST